MKNWNGTEIQSAQSKGGVQVVAHPLDNIISTGCLPWPTSEVLQKLYQSNHVSAFQGDQLEVCKSGVGYYCDLQSLHSEDAITWSVFGTVARANQAQKEKWVADLFEILDLREASSEHADIFLWRRIPHPDTLVPGGPEIDFGILTRNALVLGEAKWLSGVGIFQGKNKDKDQIRLRGEFLKEYGRRLFTSTSIHAVVGLSLFQDAFTNTAPSEVLFRAATWEEVCTLPSHPNADEVQRYFKWKKENTKTIRSSSLITRI